MAANGEFDWKTKWKWWWKDHEEFYVLILLMVISLGCWFYWYSHDPRRVCEDRGHVFTPQKCEVFGDVPRFIIKDVGDSTIVYHHTQRESLYTCLRCGWTMAVFFDVKDSVLQVTRVSRGRIRQIYLGGRRS